MLDNKQVRENAITIGITTIVIVICLIILPKVIMGDSLTINGVESNTVENDSGEVKTTHINITGNNKVKVYRAKTGKVEELDIEDYVVGVVSGEMPVDFNDEAIKAQAIAARTYYFSKRESKCEQAKGADICDTIHCQVYMNKKERLNAWDKKSANSNYERIDGLVKSTAGLVISYDNEIIKYPQFFSTSWGKTENSEDVFTSAVPYLKSINSPGEEVAPRYSEEKTISNSEFVKIAKRNFGVNINPSSINSSIEVLTRTDGGAVDEIKIGDKMIKGKEFRKVYDINSANFTLEYLKGNVKILTKGFGHGVGMSQWGANVMGEAGSNYNDILTHYYTGVEIKKINYK